MRLVLPLFGGGGKRRVDQLLEGPNLGFRGDLKWLPERMTGKIFYMASEDKTYHVYR